MPKNDLTTHGWRRALSLLLVTATISSAVLVGAHVHHEDGSNHHHTNSDQCQICVFAHTVFTATPTPLDVSFDLCLVEILSTEIDTHTNSLGATANHLRAPPEAA